MPISAEESEALSKHRGAAEYEAMEKIYESVLRREPENRVAKRELKDVKRWIDIRQRVRTEAAEKGDDALRASINRAKENGKDPRFRIEGRRYLLAKSGSAADWCAFGRELGKDGAYQEALGAYRHAMALDNSDQMRRIVYVAAAAVLRRMGDPEKAGELLGQVLDQEPNNEYAQNALRGIISDYGSGRDGPYPSWLESLIKARPANWDRRVGA